MLWINRSKPAAGNNDICGDLKSSRLACENKGDIKLYSSRGSSISLYLLHTLPFCHIEKNTSFTLMRGGAIPMTNS